MPLEVAVQKLRGFVCDQNAKIISTTQNKLSLELTDKLTAKNRRKSDREVTFTIDLLFSENHVERTNTQGLVTGRYVETHVDVNIRPRRDRDRRLSTTMVKARGLMGSLKSYLIAMEHDRRATLAVDEQAVAPDVG